jgi:hypothetical protein
MFKNHDGKKQNGRNFNPLENNFSGFESNVSEILEEITDHVTVGISSFEKF